MIPQARSIGTQTLGVTATTMKIEANAYSFRMLTDNLYTDKLQSVLRELISNALDATIAAGEDFPVTVRFDGTTLHVRDFGIGMSHEFMEDNYTSLFSSDKRESNNFTGMLGIGSKSPFALVNAYIVKCFTEDDVRTYNVFLNDGGIPQLALVSQEPGEFTTGVEVIVNIPDEYKFELEKKVNIMRLATYGKPVVYKGVTVASAKIPTELAPGFVMYTDPATSDGNHYYRGYDTKVYIRQGSAVYPIQQTVNSSLCRILKPTAFVIDVPLGTFGVTPSREALSLEVDDRVKIDRLVEKTKDLLADYTTDQVQAITKDMTDIDDVAEAMSKKFNVGNETGYELARELTSLRDKWESKDFGLSLSSNGRIVLEFNVFYKLARAYASVIGSKPLSELGADWEKRDQRPTVPYRYSGRSEQSQMNINYDSVIFFIKKGTRYRKERIDEWLNANPKYASKHMQFVHGDDEDAALLAKALPFKKHIKIVPTSEIPVIKKERPPRPKSMTTYFVWDGTVVTEKQENTSVEDEDYYILTTIGNAVLFDLDKPLTEDREMNRGSFRSLLRFLGERSMLPKDRRIVLVPKSQAKTVADVTPIAEYVAGELRVKLASAVMSKPHSMPRPANHVSARSYMSDFSVNYSSNSDIMSWLRDNYPALFAIGVMVDMHRYLRADLSLYSELHDYAKGPTFQWKNDETYIALVERYAEKAIAEVPMFVYADYEMLRVVPRAHFRQYLDDRITQPTQDEINHLNTINGRIKLTS